MNPYKLGIILFAVFCVTVALGIAYHKWVIPWMDEKDWQRRTVEAKKLQLKREAMAAQRRMAVKNGRTERQAPGDRNVAS